MLGHKLHRTILRKLMRSTRLFNTESQPNLDVNYLCDTKNLNEIEQNIQLRKGIGNIRLALELKNKLDQTNVEDVNHRSTRQALYSELLKIPNKTHPTVATYKDTPKVVKLIGDKPEFAHQPKEFDEIVKRLKLARLDQLGNLSGNRSYYILGELAELEHALTRYIVSRLLKENFELISVPDILPRHVIEACGMETQGKRTQVYALDSKLHGKDLCLSGTSEMAIAGFLSGKTFDEKTLPLKLAAISRCYRAEASSTAEERSIYRVHEFTKIEMFIVAKPQDSDRILDEIVEIQENLFKSLGLHFQVLDMPGHELGAPAYRKYDIEAWMAGRQLYGEISSCSNCTDYQSRRLGIKCGDGYVHTLNGTAGAIPRLLIALVEGGQNRNGTITIPDVLQDYMEGKNVIGKQKRIPELRLLKYRKWELK